MSKMTDDLRNSVITYCAKLGEDPLLIQGAGGNVSWKEDGILWVKASGTWLAEALEKDIFVPVDLAHMQEVLNEGDFTSPPVVCGNSQLRPSIETQLHALMSHRVVVHVHSVVALVHLVCDGWFEYFQSSLGDTIPWTAVSYKKPGAELAEAVFSALHKTKDAKVIFLQNHGVVIGGNDVADIEQTLDIIINSLSPALKSPPADFHEVKSIQNDISSLYSPISDSNIHELAINPEFFSRINTCWALYPDHVVFLGARPNIFKNIEELHEYLSVNAESPELVFIEDMGVFVKDSFNKAKVAQLRCYYDVLVRVNGLDDVNVLTQSQIGELLNWDAEKYRMHIAN